MNKPVTLITTALLTFGFAAASMAADVPKTAAPTAADSTTPSKPATTKSHKPSKKHKKAATPPATTK